MAITNARLSYFLQKTIELLEGQTHYEWGHSGACNCGHLAQVMTGYSKVEIHRWAMEKDGDWSVKAKDYCETSGYKIDDIISIMLSQGLQIEDIQHIEYLNNRRILERLPDGRRHLQRNEKDDVVAYFRAWVDLLNDEYQKDQSWSAKKSEPKDSIDIYDSVPEEEYS